VDGHDLERILGDLPEPDGFTAILGGAAALGTHIGLVRDCNEDRSGVLLLAEGNRHLLGAVVCDGIGGLPHGDVAAVVALSAFATHFAALTARRHPPPLERRAEQAVLAANQAVNAHLGGTSGCTLSAILADATHVVLCHVGDSVIFSVTNGLAKRLTRRHTIQGELQRLAGDPTRVANRRDELVNYVGMADPPEVDTTSLALHDRPSRFVLMTDGAVSDAATLEPLLSHAPSCSDLTRRALALSKWVGGQDNASVIAVDLPKALHRIPKHLAPLLQTPTTRMAVHPAILSDVDEASTPAQSKPKGEPRAGKKRGGRKQGSSKTQSEPESPDRTPPEPPEIEYFDDSKGKVHQ